MGDLCIDDSQRGPGVVYLSQSKGIQCSTCRFNKTSCGHIKKLQAELTIASWEYDGIRAVTAGLEVPVIKENYMTIQLLTASIWYKRNKSQSSWSKLMLNMHPQYRDYHQRRSKTTWKHCYGSVVDFLITILYYSTAGGSVACMTRNWFSLASYKNK